MLHHGMDPELRQAVVRQKQAMKDKHDSLVLRSKSPWGLHPNG